MSKAPGPRIAIPPGAGSADVEARPGPKLAPEPQQKADCDENKLRLMRAPGESYSDVITARERRQALEKPAGGSPASSAVLSAPNVRRPTTSLQRRLSGGGETDPEGFIRPSYNAMGGASGRFGEVLRHMAKIGHGSCPCPIVCRVGFDRGSARRP